MNKKLKTTVTISKETSEGLERLCLTNNTSKGEFVKQAVSYFEKYGINPVSDETHLVEIDRIRKRLDQFFAFFKKQETNVLLKILESSERINQSTENKLDVLATGAQMKIAYSSIEKELSSILNNLQIFNHSLDIIKKGNEKLLNIQLQEMNNLAKKQEQGFLLLGRLIDAKEKTGYFTDIAKLYNNPK